MEESERETDKGSVVRVMQVDEEDCVYWVKKESVLRALHMAIEGREALLKMEGGEGGEGGGGQGEVLRRNEGVLLGRMRDWLVRVLGGGEGEVGRGDG
jgi:hypothetical protein